MKKYLAIILLIVVLLSACKKEVKSTPLQETVQELTPEVEEVAEAVPAVKESAPASSFDNVKDAFAYGRPMKCTMMIENVQSTMWIEGESKYASESTVQGMKSHMLFLKPMVYTWSDQTPQGLKFNVDTIQPQGVQVAPSDPGEIERISSDVNCVPMAAPAGTFTVPNKEFLNMEDLVAQMMKDVPQQ